MDKSLLEQEKDFLITCALRFDGWKYKERTDWDHMEGIGQIMEHNAFPDLVRQVHQSIDYAPGPKIRAGYLAQILFTLNL